MKLCLPLAASIVALATGAVSVTNLRNLAAAVTTTTTDTSSSGVAAVATVTVTDASSSGEASSTSAPTSKTSAGSVASGGTDTDLSDLEVLSYPQHSYHMPAVRAVHARVQGDAPILVDGKLVSYFGGGELEAGYLAALDTVNTASVEGALMYVQAEGINYKARSDEDRCERKNGMRYIVFYEVLVAQTNETLAQFQSDWETPEYGPMIPMDAGRCTPLAGSGSSLSDFPVECLQFSGQEGQPNVGPFVGGGTKDDDVRAPYPNTYWFSFPNTCPLSEWADKTEQCRLSTRRGLCEYGFAPNGVDCTFAYDILGFIAIDDVVGITQIVKDNATLETYANFSEWCEASEDHVEFIADPKTGEFEQGLPFWEDPLDAKSNAERAAAVIDTYTQLLGEGGGSPQIADELVASFKTLPTAEELAAVNPPCFMTVKSCGTAPGCKRVGYSQICTPCQDGEGCELTDGSFVFPTLAKAKGEGGESEADESYSGRGSTDGSNGALSMGLTLASAATMAVAMAATMQ